MELERRGIAEEGRTVRREVGRLTLCTFGLPQNFNPLIKQDESQFPQRLVSTLLFSAHKLPINIQAERMAGEKTRMGEERAKMEEDVAGQRKQVRLIG